MGNKRRRFTSAFKSKVVVEALSERFTVQELARKHELHPKQITTWVFSVGRGVFGLTGDIGFVINNNVPL